VTAESLDPVALHLIEDYLTQLATALGQRDRTSRDMVAEVRDGLLTAVEKDIANGRPAIDAARTAVRLCGAVAQVVPVMRVDVVATRARSTVVSLLRTAPFAAAAWVATMATSPASPWQVGDSSPWRVVAPWLGLGVLLTLSCSLLANTAAAGTGRQSPRLANVAAIAAAVACVCTDLAGLAFIAVSAAIAPAMFAWPVIAAAAVSGARIVFAGHRIQRLRRPLPA
jgi:hypothetical protein